MLDLMHVSQSYGRKAVLSDVTHKFSQGVTVITGPSGAGKSTLLRICATAETPKTGQVTWRGAKIAKAHFRSHLGYAPQRIDFPEDISAIDFLLHMAALKNLRRGPAKIQALELLNRLGLGRDAQGRILTYSGGMRRRLGLAQAFLGTPELLILDEPTAELDPVTAGHIHNLIFETANRAVVLMTTHLQDSLSDRAYQTLQIDPLA